MITVEDQSRVRAALRVISCGVAALLLVGCTPESLGFTEQATSSVIAARTQDPVGTRTASRTLYLAVDRMAAGAPAVTPNVPVLVATLTNAQRIEAGSPFGNIMADMIRTRLTQQGLTVSELRLRNSVRMSRDNGELLLARESRSVVPARAYGAVVTGTYAVGSTNVLVSLKMVSATDGRILSAVDVVLPRYPDIDGLLNPPPPNRRTARHTPTQDVMVQ